MVDEKVERRVLVLRKKKEEQKQKIKKRKAKKKKMRFLRSYPIVMLMINLRW